MRAKKRITLGTCALLLTACGHSTGITEDPEAVSYGTITISSGVNEETELVAHLYAKALQQVGYSTEIIDTGDSRADYLAQLEKNLDPTPSATANRADTIDLAPDYAGELLMYLTDDAKYSVSYLEQQEAAASASATPTPSETVLPEPSPTPQDTSLNVTSLNSTSIHDSIGRLLPEGLQTLNGSAADPKHGLYITRALAGSENYSTLADIEEDCSTLAFAMPATYENSSYLGKSLATYYGCTPQVMTQDSDQTQRVLDLTQNTVQLADLRTTLPEVQDNALIRLDDPTNIFISQNITPIVRSNEMPESARTAINTVSERLTNDELTKLLRLTTGEQAVSYENIATFWLEQSQE